MGGVEEERVKVREQKGEREGRVLASHFPKSRHFYWKYLGGGGLKTAVYCILKWRDTVVGKRGHQRRAVS